jgi:threonine/homoserine/homoserine lactone efflux protein
MLEIIRNLALGVSIAAPIGPVSLEVIRRGMRHGFKSAISVAAGAFTADVGYLFLFTFGFADFLPSVRTYVWLLGAMVLGYLGYHSIKEYKHLDKEVKPASRNAFLSGLLVTSTSPITALWWFGIVGSMASAQIGKAELFLTLLPISIGALLWFFCFSIVLDKGRRFVTDKMLRYLSLIAGIALLCFAGYFLYRAI